MIGDDWKFSFLQDPSAEAAGDRLALVLEVTNAGLWEWDIEGSTLHLSPRCYDILGVPADNRSNPADLIRAIHPDDLQQVAATALKRLEDDGDEGPLTFRTVSTNGKVRWVQCAGRVIVRDIHGVAMRAVGTLIDVTSRKSAEEQLRIAAVAFQSADAMLIADAKGIILQVNPAFTEVTGYSAEEAIGRTPALLKSGRHDGAFYRTLWEAVAREGHWEGKIWNRRKDGEIYPEWLSISAVRDRSGAVTHYLCTFSDISEPREREQKIVELAFYDPLTGLPNRRLFMDRLRQALAASARGDQFGSLLLLDLDHFKILNDSRGHNSGDELLTEVARRLRAALRETDSAARLGGDEFAVLLEGLGADEFTAANAAETIAEKLRAAVRLPGAAEGKDYRITPSIGIALFRGHRNDPDRLLRHAELALYQAKAAGRDTIRFYSPEMQAAIEAHAEMEAGLRHALEQGGLELHYQPKVDLRLGCVIGAEALIRWRSEDGKLVPPDAFIPFAEQTGIIVPIGEWVVETACRQMATWRRAGLPPVRVAVNVSARQFEQANFSQTIAQALRIHELEPKWLELELTESAVMTSPEKTAAILHELKRIGVRISLDDFGTGYSSLGYLKRFPLDGLKIDRSFVRDITTNADDAAIAEMIVALAHTLKQTVVAEGVETEEQMAFLRRMRCDQMQGYLFSRPLPAKDFTAMLSERRKLCCARGEAVVQ